MQRLRRMILVAVVMVLSGCSSSSDPLPVEFTAPMGPDAGPAEVSGAAVDEGLVCDQGTLTRLRIEDTDGELVSDDEGMRLWDAALESGATIEMVLYDEFECTDGSGTLSIVTNNVVQPSALDFESSNDVGTWEIQDGTGSYEGSSGEGTYYADFGKGYQRFAGEIGEG
jgi:hypothetical protein